MACKFAAQIQNNYNARITSFRALLRFWQNKLSKPRGHLGQSGLYPLTIIDIGRC